ncbi:MAG: UDP-N-acetylmuramoyl-L-alanyl-D-glutamate--2,6-diaminopimelate ligase [Myxococcales bacterium]|nr:UDP-N-acetylmuramoyl-L-alanyl-D-glutamate--2,6-diaminopimelate ligase [Myxococcales bacterium]
MSPAGEVTLARLHEDGIGRAIVDSAGVDPGAVVVRGVRHDSRAVQPGDLFAALPGEHVDGARFATSAAARGAVAFLATRPLGAGRPTLVSGAVRRDLARASHRVYGDPTAALDVVGITGTNGKTTTAFLVDAMLARLGCRPALSTTVMTRVGSTVAPASHTTPEADDLARVARDAVRARATHLVMEVSSHGLALDRVEAVRFRVAAFTNLTQDHLDFHGTMAAYGEAKARLFTELHPRASVVNVADPFGATLASRASGACVRCAPRALPAGVAADVEVLSSTSGPEGIHAEIATPSGQVRLESPLVGAHNLENLVVALGCAVALDLDVRDAAAALGAAPAAPGRLERIAHPRGVLVLVDYAHTPDALARAIDAVRDASKGRLFVVFGAGGERDRTKRAPMGRAVAERADGVVLTNDNPRGEPPAQIFAEVEAGLRDAGASPVEPGALARERGYVVEPDRAAAIAVALAAARAGDAVLIAGKGHEPYQIIGEQRLPFDDREVARRAIAALAEGGR